MECVGFSSQLLSSLIFILLLGVLLMLLVSKYVLFPITT